VIGNHFDDVRIGDFGAVFDALLESAHGDLVVFEEAEHGGVDGGRVEHRLVTLNVDDDLSGGGGGGFGDAVGAGDVIGASHDDARAEVLGGVANARVVGGDHDVGEIARLRGTLPNVLQHGFPGDRDESFAGESGRCVPGWNHAKNAERHNRI
jgi:hypothetical protein